VEVVAVPTKGGLDGEVEVEKGIVAGQRDAPPDRRLGSDEVDAEDEEGAAFGFMDYRDFAALRKDGILTLVQAEPLKEGIGRGPLVGEMRLAFWQGEAGDDRLATLAEIGIMVLAFKLGVVRKTGEKPKAIEKLLSLGFVRVPIDTTGHEGTEKKGLQRRVGIAGEAKFVVSLDVCLVHLLAICRLQNLDQP